MKSHICKEKSKPTYAFILNLQYWMQFVSKIAPQLNKMYAYEKCGSYNKLTTVDIQ